jgi:hypothetical protein
MVLAVGLPLPIAMQIIRSGEGGMADQPVGLQKRPDAVERLGSGR